jgi:hypothetical protein
VGAEGVRPGLYLVEHHETPQSLDLENRERTLEPFDVSRIRVDEEVDVFRRPLAAMEDDGEPPDQDVPGPGLVEGAADRADIFERRRADLRHIWLVIHCWASSKVSNRNSPRGASPVPPRSAQAVRSRVSTVSGVDTPSRRRPTTRDGSRSISRSRFTRQGYASDASAGISPGAGVKAPRGLEGGRH